MSLRLIPVTRASCVRFAFFLGVWFMVAGWKPVDLPIGLAASAIALWISVSLRPATERRPRVAMLALLVLRFLGGSIAAGMDVARRAFLPTLDLRPGLVAVPISIPAGTLRSAFLLCQSLQPGSSPTSAEGDVIQVHCLDVSQPTAAVIAADEALFRRAFGDE